MRARRQRVQLLQAVRAAVLEHPQKPPTVGSILKKCRLGRNTFYGHFSNVEAATETALAEDKEQITAALSSDEGDPLITPGAAVRDFTVRLRDTAQRRTDAVRMLLAHQALSTQQLLQGHVRRLAEVGHRAGSFRTSSASLERALAAACASLLGDMVARPEAAPAFAEEMEKLILQALR